MVDSPRDAQARRWSVPDAPRLIVFSDTTRAPVDLMLERFARLALSARPGSVLFVLRDYGLSARARLALGLELRALARLGQQSFGLADRVDLARALAADALHLPELGLGPQEARSLLGSAVFVSRACHDRHSPVIPGVDALLVSPIFAARKGRPALGLTALGKAHERGPESPAQPLVYALGGVGSGNAAACVAAGAKGVAVIGAALTLDHGPLLRALAISRG
jgi:thiamine-phosphate pyrophosphorylase